MDIVYTTHTLLIHFITTRTFDMKSLYHSTYFLNISLTNRVLPFKNPKTPFIFTLFYLLHFCYIRVKGQHSRTCRVERSNLYSNTFLKWQVHLKCFRRLKTALNHYINFSLSSMSYNIPISWNIVVMILTDTLPVYCNLYLVITRALARVMPGAEPKTPFPDSVTHHPKAVLVTGWWLVARLTH